MSWIEARIEFSATASDRAITADDIPKIVEQVRIDALFGTFHDLHEDYWRDLMGRSPDSLSRAKVLRQSERDPKTNEIACEFSLSLPADLFPPECGGLQHLFGILAGDLLQFTLPPLRVTRKKVVELNVPEGLQKATFECFRNAKSNDIDSIRRQLNVEEGIPLLAFSVKPRIGFQLEKLESLASDVLAEGFHVVELDTRFIAKDQTIANQLTDIAKRLADRHPSGRFSINLSVPTDLALKWATLLCKEVKPPVVFKIDGGFDGLSTLQAIRREGIRDKSGNPPIITCYPLLRTTIGDFVPSAQYVDALALSGADVIYPGGRPDIGKMKRSLGGQEHLSLISAVDRYRSLVAQTWPMPSIAGGIYAGQLHAFYELLGPKVAWFLGGGIALHKAGPRAGAKLCMQVAVEARELREKSGRKWSKGMRLKLAEACEEMYEGQTLLSEGELEYFAPEEAFRQFTTLSPY